MRGEKVALPDSFLDELRDRLNIVDVVSNYVHLTPRGGDFWACCPFHNEKTPSFHVEPDRQIYYCFGCHKGGGAIKFVQEYEHISFMDAVQKLAAQVGMQVPEDGQGSEEARNRRKRILELNKEAARFFRATLQSPEGAKAQAYIREKRRITNRISARFGLGAAPDAWTNLIQAMAQKGYDKRDLLDAGLAVSKDRGNIYDKFRNRLMLPVIDVRGDVIGFTSRILDDNPNAPKYMNTPETQVFRKRSVLYGLNYAKTTKRPNLILVEGNIDVITMHQAGFDNTIATMGTALTEEHVRILSRYTKELVLCLDNDAAGEDATQRAITVLKQSDINVRVLRLPQRRMEDGSLGKQDPDDYIKNYGPASFQALMDGSSNSVEYRLTVVERKYHLDQDDQKAAYLQEAATVIAGLESPIEREIYAGRCATVAGVSKEAVLQEVEQIRKQKYRKARREEERFNMVPGRQIQPQARELRYQNLRSAKAEIQVLQVILLDGAYFQEIPDLDAAEFSSPLLGKAFSVLKRRWQEGYRVSLNALEAECTGEELDALMSQLRAEPNRQTASAVLRQCATVIHEEHTGHNVTDENDLLQMAERKRKKYIDGG